MCMCVYVYVYMYVFACVCVCVYYIFRPCNVTHKHSLCHQAGCWNRSFEQGPNRVRVGLLPGTSHASLPL